MIHHHPIVVPGAVCDGDRQCKPACRYRRSALRHKKDAEIAKKVSATVLPTPPRLAKCLHLGAERRVDGRPETVECLPCKAKGSKAANLKTRDCAVFGRCTAEIAVEGVACCIGCGAYAPGSVEGLPRSPQAVGIVEREILIPGASLAGSNDGTHFNPSMIDYQGRRLFCYRTGRNGSQTHICQLDERFQPGPSRRLELGHERAIDGREDPRLFVHDGRLHVSYGGYNGKIGGPGLASCLYARLTDDLQVEQIHYPRFHERATWEKNWTWFSWGGELFAIYDVVPHTVLHVVHDRATLFQKATWSPKWSGGLLRGGASPVLVGDEFWCFFHGCVEPGGQTPYGPAQRRMYSIGVYTFEARPPFKPVRCTAEPIAWADPWTQPTGFWCDCLFAAGAVLDGERWLVSAGVHDAWCAVYEFDRAAIEKAMVPA